MKVILLLPISPNKSIRVNGFDGEFIDVREIDTFGKFTSPSRKERVRSEVIENDRTIYYLEDSLIGIDKKYIDLLN